MQVVQIFKPSKPNVLSYGLGPLGPLPHLHHYLLQSEDFHLTLVDAELGARPDNPDWYETSYNSAALEEWGRWSKTGERNVRMVDLLTYWGSCRNGELGPEWDDELINRASSKPKWR
jgi:hypothetical protein